MILLTHTRQHEDQIQIQVSVFHKLFDEYVFLCPGSVPLL